MKQQQRNIAIMMCSLLPQGLYIGYNSRMVNKIIIQLKEGLE